MADAPDARFDAAIVCLGVNDAKNGVARGLFARRMETLLDTLITRFQTRRIVLSGLPPLHRFPILPSPLNATERHYRRSGVAFRQNTSRPRAQPSRYRPCSAGPRNGPVPAGP
ncbi:hypothetical protein [Palleronia sp. THAF1]|uniref:hypothetical protein n=1 Tax=Palleronia sp. THAF1 TaxID=2587842 RepID=UPI0039B87F92